MIKINGKVVSTGNNCSSIIMNGDGIIIDGKKVDFDEITDDKKINIVIADCTIGNIDCGDVEIHGSKIHNLDAKSCRIEGNVEGDVDGHNVTVNGSVGGNIDCNVANVSGNINGKVKANIVNR